MGSLTITSELVTHGPAAAFVLDDEQVADLGEGAKRFPVRVTVNGTTLRLSVARMGGEYLIGFSRANRAAAGLEPGDAATITLELDDSPREVDVPPALAEALTANAAAHAAFEKLAFTHRKEFARWVQEAKREETRDRRVTETLAMLRDGRTRS
jgi:hypothetical protein